MTSNDDSGIDAGLRKAWRATASERTPLSLDSDVLRRAAAAAGRRRWLPTGWLQPVAVGATLALGAAVVFDLRPIPGDAGDRAPVEAPLADGAADAVRRRFEESADGALRTLQDVAASAPASLAAGREASDPAQVATEPFEDAARRSCNDAARRSAESWWACADELDDMGQVQAAQRERELLRQRFPGFDPPD